MPNNCQALNSPNGVLKLLHVVLGAVSLLLIAATYVSYWALDIFLITIAVCFTISAANLILNCFLPQNLLNSKANKTLGFIFHLAAGTSLILAGIDLIGWSEYDQHCGFKCPRIYYIGVAKILTFVNGTLYAIHGFLDARGEDEEDFLSSESFPLLNRLTPTIVVQTPSPPPSWRDQMDGSYQNVSPPTPHFSGSGSAPNPSIKSIIN